MEDISLYTNVFHVQKPQVAFWNFCSSLFGAPAEFYLNTTCVAMDRHLRHTCVPRAQEAPWFTQGPAPGEA